MKSILRQLSGIGLCLIGLAAISMTTLSWVKWHAQQKRAQGVAQQRQEHHQEATRPKTYAELCPQFPLFCEEWRRNGYVK